MLAPIVTKDMKLFPSRPLPAHVKNVRSRAQSLQDFDDSNSRQRHQQQKPRVAHQPAQQRNALSTGNLSSAPTAPTSTVKSPSKGSLVVKRKPLDPIAEGVELSTNASSRSSSSANMTGQASNLTPCSSMSKLGARRDPSSAAAAATTAATDEYGKLIRCPAIDLAAAKSSPDQELCSLQELGVNTTRPSSSMSTASEPSDLSAKSNLAKSKSTNTGLIKFFTSAFKGRTKSHGLAKCHQEAAASGGQRKKPTDIGGENSTTVPS